MMAFSASRSTFETKSLRPFSSICNASRRSIARSMICPAWRAARKAVLAIGCMSKTPGRLRRRGMLTGMENDFTTDPRLDRVRVVLEEPSHPGNIGRAARALDTMGLADLGVVNPLRFPDPQAQWRAAGAQDVLDAVTVYESVEAAVADCNWVVGTSTRSRRIPWPVKSAEEVAAAALSLPLEHRVAVLF